MTPCVPSFFVYRGVNMKYRRRIEELIDNEFGSIQLSKFLSRYYPVCGRDLREITHQEAQKLFSDLRTMDLYDLNKSYAPGRRNLEKIYTGEIIIVNDGREIVAYYAPELSLELEDLTHVNREEEDVRINDEVYDYACLSEYRLRELLRRKFNSYRNQTCARRELQKRGIEITKKYKRNNFKNWEE